MCFSHELLMLMFMIISAHLC
uniref:Uncharacterized protein n=1 Tax=Anguilla anguilla TaxID=7936 RepID=A0A0E9VBW0_ANGAN